MAKILRRSEKRAGVFADVLLLFAAATSLWLGSGPAECSELLSTLTEQKYIELEAGALPEDLPKKLCPCGSGLGVLTQNGELLWLANKKEKAVSMGRGFADLACFGRDLIAATEGELLFIDGNGAARAEKIGRLPAGEKIEWIRVINGKFPLVASASWLIRFDLTGTELRQHRTVQVDGPILGIDTTKDLTLITRTGIYHFDEDLTCLWSHEWADALPPVIWDRDSVFLDVSPDNDTIWVGLNSRIDEKNTMGFVCSYDRAAGSFRFKRIFNGKIVFLGGVCGYELLSFEGDASPIQEEDYQGTSSTETAEELEGSEAVPGPKAFVMTQEGKFKKYFSTKAPVAAFYQLGAALYAVQTGGMIQVFRSCLENDLISIGYTSTIISSTARYDWNEDGYPDLIIAGRVYYGPEISERPRCVSVYVSKIPRILEIAEQSFREGRILFEQGEFANALFQLDEARTRYERILGDHKRAEEVDSWMRKSEEKLRTARLFRRLIEALAVGLLVTVSAFGVYKGSRWLSRRKKKGPTESPLLTQDDYDLVHELVLHDGTKKLAAMARVVGGMATKTVTEKDLSYFLDLFESWRKHCFHAEARSIIQRMEPCRYQAQSLLESEERFEQSVESIRKESLGSTPGDILKMRELLERINMEIKQGLDPAIRKGVRFTAGEILSYVIRLVSLEKQEEGQKYGITLRFLNGFQDEVPWIPPAKQHHLQRVFHNLIENSFEAVHAAAVKDHEFPPDRREIQTALEPLSRGGAEVRIQDRGIGMEEAVLQSWLEPGFTTKPHGMGYGITREDVDRIKEMGAFRIESAPGEGTSIWIEIWEERLENGIRKRAQADDSDC